MDILLLCHRIPYPPNKGDKIRSHALLTELAKRHRVHVGCFVDDPSDFEHVETVRRLAGGECLFLPVGRAGKWLSAARAIFSGQPVTTAYFGSPRLSDWIDAVAQRHAIEQTVLFSSAMAPYVLDNSRLEPDKTILDMVDVDSDKWLQYAQTTAGLRRWIYGREARLLQRLERTAARHFKATLLSSPFEAESFIAIAPESTSKVGVIHNGVNWDYFSPGDFENPFPKGEQPIVMTGKMDYHPNADGVKWFFREVMGRLSAELPAARFYVVGSNPPASLQSLAGPKLVLCGHVPDVRPYLHHAGAVVAPLQIARGVQNKVLEAMAMAKPLVTTPVAARALAARAGEHLWIENSPAGFAAAVVAAIKGNDRQRIAANAREYVTHHHDWSRNLAVLHELMSDDHHLPDARDGHGDAHPSREIASSISAARSSVGAF